MSASGEKVKKIIKELETDCENKWNQEKTMDEVLDIFLKDSAISKPLEDGFRSERTETYFDMKELKHWKEQMNQTYEIHYDREIVCFRTYFRATIIFVKRLIRKICRSLIQSIIEEQNSFNANTTACINTLFNNEVVTEEFLSEIKSKLEQYQDRLSEMEDAFRDRETRDHKADFHEEMDSVLKKLLHENRELKQDIAKEIKKEYTEYAQQEIGKIKDEVFGQIQNYESELKNKYKQIKAENDWRYTQEELKLFRNIRKNSIKAQNHRELPDCPKEQISAYGEIDYFDFENYFRGSRQDIKQRQSIYIPYFTNKHRVIDLGCGRGEFLELLKENNISYTGVDSYQEFADYCEAKELNVICADAVQYLASIENGSLGGIFAAQIIEHLSNEYLIYLCHLAYEKLENGAFLIMETPNPMCLSIYTNSFYMDLSHQKPVHPKMMEYLLKREGFRKIDILYTEESKSGYRLPLLKSDGAHNISEFNSGINVLSDLLFGSEDYAIIAQK